MGKGRTKATYPKIVNMPEEPQQQGEPKMPSHLGAIAKKEFRRLVKHLSQTVVLNEADGNAIGAYCAAYQRWVEAEEQIAKEGLTVDSRNGKRQHPAVQIASEQIKTMERIGKEFGLTPAARNKLNKNQDEKPKENKLLNFIKKVD